MKTDLAIELLHSLQGDTPEQLATPTQKAIRLGIEALKNWKTFRATPFGSTADPLPGETERKGEN